MIMNKTQCNQLTQMSVFPFNFLLIFLKGTSDFTSPLMNLARLMAHQIIVSVPSGESVHCDDDLFQ